MNIAVWFNMPSEKAGGGFNYAIDIIQQIDQYEFDPSLNFIFLSYPPFNEPYLKYVTKKEIFQVPGDLPPSFSSLKRIARVYNFFLKGRFSIGRKINSTLSSKLRELQVASIREKNIHLIFYPVQQEALFDEVPFVSNNWDLGHLSTHSFPELLLGNQYEHRNYWYNTTLKKAFAVFAESETGKNELINYLQINPEKIKIVPHFYSFQSFPQNTATESGFLEKHRLVKSEYLFYPAQFWAHKNHYNLIIGFKNYLNSAGDNRKNIKLALTGSDQGNLNYILNLVKENGLENNVHYLGFVSKAEISVLYKNASALIFPSFLGPSNLPLIEAMYHNCYVVCSDLEGHRELCGKAALYFQPESPQSIAEAIGTLMETDVRKDLETHRKEWINNAAYSSEKVMPILEKNFMELRNIRLCWD